MKSNATTGQRFHTSEGVASRAADEILAVLVERGMKYMGDGTAGSVVKTLWGWMEPDRSYDSQRYHAHRIVDGLNYLEFCGVVHLERQTLRHAPGITTGQRGNKIVRLTVNT